ncbi:restriction endonuclease subunit S [Haemophilus sp.]
MKNNRTFLEKLLDGAEVEWKPLDEIFHLKNGYTPSKGVKEYWENGSIPWFRMEDIRENGRVLNTALQKVSESAVKGGKLFPANSIIIATSATIGEHALITIPFLANQRFTVLSLKSEYIDKFNIYFLYHYCFTLDDWCQKNTTMSSFASVDMNGFRKFPIPIPPLSVQTEIVRILDALTALTSELTSELILRQKQYEYYREKLLSFDSLEQLNSGGGEKKLIDVAKIKNGKDWKHLEEGNIPIYGSGGIMGYVDTYSYDKPTVLIPRKGTITNIFYLEEPFWNVDTIYYTEIDTTQILPKYFYHFMKTVDLTKLDTGSGRPSLTQAILNEIPIFVPSIEEQQRIVSILDKFETLTNSITEGLPLAIEQSQKQYEYYRELLLNFS